MSFLPEIIQASLSLEERIRGTKGFFLPWAKPEPIVAKRWQRWQEICGDERRFKHRLKWAGLQNRGLAYAVLGEGKVAVQPPSWAEVLARVVARFEQDLVPSIPYLGEPVPFEELFIPFIEEARSGLRFPDRWQELVSPEVEAVLCRQLLGWLVNLAGRALLEQFSLFRLAEQPMMARLIFHLPNYHSTQLYQQFIGRQKQDGMVSFLRTYPVLARLMCRVTELWIEATQELIDRLDRDYELLLSTFGITGKIVKLQPELGDPHNGGRTVAAIEFSSGQKLVYKPRSLAVEQAFTDWVNWVNGLEGLLDLRTAKVLDRGDYGWMTFIEAKPCHSQEEVSNFYRRLGQLLALLYILAGNDCHYENLIAQGEYPVLVDLETLLHHEFYETIPQELRQGNEALYLAQSFLQRSVLRVGLLPRWEGSGNNTIDLSGMGSGDREQEVAQVPKWEDVNTDKMRLGQAPLYVKPTSSSPILADQPAQPTQYTEEFVEGFCSLWSAIAQNKDHAPLDRLQNLPLRTIYRPTQTYGNILEYALRPQYLRHGIDFSIELERLARPLLWMEAVHPLWALVEAETRSLLQYDMPFFRSNSSSRDLWAGDKKNQPILRNCFELPSAEAVAQTLERLTPQHLEEQVNLIRNSLYAVDLTSAPTFTPQSLTWQSLPPATPQDAIEQALAIGLELEKRAFYGTDGSIAWIGLGLVPDSDKFRLQPVEYSLYDGSVGIALFLAALYYETKDKRWRKLALGAIQPLEFLLNNQELMPLFIDSIGIGGAVGLGSILYGLTKISQFLGENSLLITADRVARLITAEIIKADRVYDVLGGSAGAILSLLALHRITGKPHLLDRALQCGNHLLEQRTPTPTGHRAWKAPDLNHLTGFSHGAAGIAYALLELYRVTRRSEFWEAAQEAIAFEEAVFIETEQNYPDFRFSNNNSCMNSWCHGAAGIALARLGGLKTLDNTDLRTAIERALNTTQRAGMQPIDHLCCGNLGRMETLLTAAQVLDRADLNATIKAQLANLLHRARQTGGFYLFPDLPKSVFNPGFFQGVSGIGYALLRIARPDRYPSVLLWQ